MQSHLPLLPERIETEKCGELVCNLYNKKNYAIHIKTLQAWNHGFHRVIEFNQEICLKYTLTLTQNKEQKQKMILRRTSSSS